ncbi:MAG TPA: hypothetical protein VH234_05515 [Candidatus Saccharimonadales bacterium]|jgi:hypothetical protein|nr:hypothetical protein [Candidatus Saccharimonadales bacterium]
MREAINQEVSVVSYYSARDQEYKPHLLHWQNKDYPLGKVDYHHAPTEGKTLFHIYELCDKEQTIWFRLKLNTDNMHWLLEAVSDGLAN